MTSLSKAVNGKRYEILWMIGIPEITDFFEKQKITEGSFINVICQNYGAVIFSDDSGKRYAISEDIADRIKI